MPGEIMSLIIMVQMIKACVHVILISLPVYYYYHILMLSIELKTRDTPRYPQYSILHHTTLPSRVLGMEVKSVEGTRKRYIRHINMWVPT